MGWRYAVIVLGCMTLAVFFLRYFVFTFYESPKFLLSKGREQEAIDVLHKIANFNKAPLPTLTVEHFAEIDRMSGTAEEEIPTAGPLNSTQLASRTLRRFFTSFKHLKGLFLNKLQLFIFVLLGIAYMVGLLVYID